jgi:hypothetical protein
MTTRIEVRPKVGSLLEIYARHHEISLTTAANMLLAVSLALPENTVTPPPSAIKSAPVKTSASTDWDDDT